MWEFNPADLSHDIRGRMNEFRFEHMRRAMLKLENQMEKKRAEVVFGREPYLV